MKNDCLSQFSLFFSIQISCFLSIFTTFKANTCHNFFLSRFTIRIFSMQQVYNNSRLSKEQNNLIHIKFYFLHFFEHYTQYFMYFVLISLYFTLSNAIKISWENFLTFLKRFLFVLSQIQH